MTELEYYKAKAKMLEFQSIRFQLLEQMATMQADRAEFVRSLGLDPVKNYIFNDEKLEFTLMEG